MRRGALVHCEGEVYDVYIGRGRCPRTGRPGQWGNPFRVIVDGEREEVIERIGNRYGREIEAGRVDLAFMASLHGKRFGCWCAPRPCHGEVLEAAALWALGQQARRLERRVAELTRQAGSCHEA